MKKSSTVSLIKVPTPAHCKYGFNDTNTSSIIPIDNICGVGFPVFPQTLNLLGVYGREYLIAVVVAAAAAGGYTLPIGGKWGKCIPCAYQKQKLVSVMPKYNPAWLLLLAHVRCWALEHDVEWKIKFPLCSLKNL